MNDLKVGPCLICQASCVPPLCAACRRRVVPVFALEPIAVFCPKCGVSPLEQNAFTIMFPVTARKIQATHGDSHVLLVYQETGCHRCADGGSINANIFAIGPKSP